MSYVVDCRARRLYNPPAFWPAADEWSGPRDVGPDAGPQNGNAVIAIDLPNPRRLALSVVLGQVTVTLLCALAAWAIADRNAAVSALLGGGASSVASLAMALIGFGKQAATDPQRAMSAFLTGEAAKVLVVIVLFVVVLKTMKVVPLAMLGAYIATFGVFWVALANGLPSLGGERMKRVRR